MLAGKKPNPVLCTHLRYEFLSLAYWFISYHLFFRQEVVVTDEEGEHNDGQEYGCWQGSDYGFLELAHTAQDHVEARGLLQQ